MRKIALGLALSSVLASNSHAVGLGEIITSSSLNQPLNASIELVDTSSGEVDGLEVTLAPTAVFDQVGISRSPALDKLEFIPTIENGVPTIKVTSLQPIQEPFLNFVIEVTWANGKLLREYTVLLDPPVFSGTQYAAVPNAAVASPVEQVTLAAPEVLVSEQRSFEGGLDPFVSIPNAGIASVGVLDTSSHEFSFEGLETFPVDESIGIPESMAFNESARTSASGFVSGGLDPFVDSIPLDTTATDGTSYALAETFAVEESTLGFVGSGAGSEDIFVADSGASSFPVAGIEDIFMSDAPIFSQSSEVGTYQIARGDTLGSISRELAEGSSVNKMMVALMRNNPNAFISNNMNLIRSGYVLRVPDAGEVASISGREALAEIASHSTSWSKYRTEVASSPLPQLNTQNLAGIEDLVGLHRDAPVTTSGVDVTVETPSGLAEVSDLASGKSTELEIMVPDGPGDAVEGDTDTGSGAIGNIGKELALSKEELVSATSENTELRSRVTELESLLASKDRLIELKNEQLSDLQGQVAEQSGSSAAEMAARDSAEQAASKVTETATGSLPHASLEDDSSAVDATGASEPIKTTLTEEPEPSVTPTKDDAEKTALLDDVKNNPNLLMGLGFGGLLLAALGWLVLRRKDEGEYVAPEVATTAAAAPIVRDENKVETLVEGLDSGKADDRAIDKTLSEIDSIPESASLDVENFSEELEELDLGAEITADSIGSGDLSVDDEDEVMSEANVYLAYGLQDQAIDLLKPVVAANPERTDYAAKLLEAYHSTDAKDEFLSLAEDVKGGISDSKDSGVWSHIAVMGKDLLPGNALFEGVDTGDLSMTQIRTKPPELTDIDMNFDDSSVQDSVDNTVSESELAEPLSITPDIEELNDDSLVLDMLDEDIKGDQVTEIRSVDFSDELKDKFDAEIDLEHDEALDSLRHTKIDIDRSELDDVLGDVDLDTSDLKLDDIELELEGELLAPSEIIDTHKVDQTLSIPMEDRLNLEGLVGEDVAEGLFSTGEDEISTKLDLAKAYLDMGDDEGAREALDEVINIGSPAQKDEAEKLKAQLT